MKIGEILAPSFRRYEMTKTYHRHRSLLRARSERQSSGASEQRDELPSPHLNTLSAIASSADDAFGRYQHHMH